MPRAASRVHRALFRALLVALLSTSGVGCLVSFDGYSYDDSEGNGEGGSSAGGSSAGGSGEAGAGGGDAGQGGAVAGQSGSSGQAGSSAGGVSGAGGNAGISGSSGQGGDGGVAGDAGSAGEGGGGGDAGSTGSAGDSGAGQGGAGNSGSAGDGGAAGDGGGGSGGNAGDGGSSVGGAGASGQGGAGQGGAGNGGAGQGGAGNGGAGQGGTGQAGSGNGGAGQGGAGMSGASGQGGAGAGQGGASGSAGQGGAGQGGAGQGGNAGSGGSAGAPFECPVNLPKPSMIEVSAPDGYVYCIDRTEVTNEQYKTFLDANVPTSGQPAFCSWNQNYAPEQSGGCSTGTFPYDPGPAGKNRAVACVDWCDAYAYCEWAGKRLCGNIEGGVNAMASYADPGKSAWYNACSLGGTMELPYGDQYLSGYCNDILSGSSGPENVTSFTACEGGVNGLYHMVGNVAEWEDSCSGQSAASDLCLARGGGFLSSDNASKEAATCDSSKVGGAPIALPPQKQRNARARDIGFRCCYP